MLRLSYFFSEWSCHSVLEESPWGVLVQHISIRVDESVPAIIHITNDVWWSLWECVCVWWWPCWRSLRMGIILLCKHSEERALCFTPTPVKCSHVDLTASARLSALFCPKGNTQTKAVTIYSKRTQTAAAPSDLAAVHQLVQWCCTEAADWVLSCQSSVGHLCCAAASCSCFHWTEPWCSVFLTCMHAFIYDTEVTFCWLAFDLHSSDQNEMLLSVQFLIGIL